MTSRATDPQSHEASRHSVFGLTVESDLPLPELPRGGGEGAADVRIIVDTIDLPEREPGYSQVEGETLLTIPKVGRFLVQAGRRVIVHPAAGATERKVRLFLLGSALGALLHQRGLLPLHANAVDLGGRAVAFSGHSGAGKSTMAVWFHDRGHSILADDVCVIGFDEAGRAVVFPGIPRLRLWREALEASGREADAYDRSFDARDKYDVPTRSAASLEPLPLHAVYLLRKADPGEAAELERLRGVDAVEMLVANTYRGAYLETIGRTGDHLAACVRIARAVPVFRASRHWGFDRFDEEASRLREHASEQVPLA
jgi:hypothetical protein